MDELHREIIALAVIQNFKICSLIVIVIGLVDNWESQACEYSGNTFHGPIIATTSNYLSST